MVDCRKCQRFSACYFDNDDCIGFMPKPQTNADRIRMMSDEELAKWMYDLTTNALSVLALGSNKQTKTISHWYDWLRKEAEDGRT